MGLLLCCSSVFSVAARVDASSPCPPVSAWGSWLSGHGSRAAGSVEVLCSHPPHYRRSWRRFASGWLIRPAPRVAAFRRRTVAEAALDTLCRCGHTSRGLETELALCASPSRPSDAVCLASCASSSRRTHDAVVVGWTAGDLAVSRRHPIVHVLMNMLGDSLLQLCVFGHPAAAWDIRLLGASRTFCACAYLGGLGRRVCSFASFASLWMRRRLIHLSCFIASPLG